MKGTFVGAAVKIVSDESERPTILGTARVQAKAQPLRETVQIRPPQPKMRTDLDIGAEKSETTTVSDFFYTNFHS